MGRLKLVTREPPRGIVALGGWRVAAYSRDSRYHQWPHRVVIWDTEGDRSEDGSDSLVCAHMRLWLRRADYTYHPEEDVLVRSMDAFWDHLHTWTRHKESMRLFCHNLMYDLGMVDWHPNITRLGYTFRPGRDLIWAESSDVPYLRIRHGQRAPLTFCDSDSIFHCQMANLGGDLDMPAQPPLDSPEERCRWDTQALASAILEHYYPWLLEHETSPKSPTGTGHGWAYFMANHYHDRTVYHHEDQTLLDYELASRYGTGRREGWRHGPVEERVEEWDYQYAHATICLEPLPVAVLNPGYQAEDTTTLTDYLAETDVPCLPYRKDDGTIIYPVGRFPVRLWGPEAAMAMDAGAKLSSYPEAQTYTYERQPFMESWGSDLIDLIESCQDKVVRRALKIWSHRVCGKWAQMNAVYDPLPDAFWPPEFQTEAMAIQHFSRGEEHRRVLHTHAGAWGIRDEAEPAHHANVAVHSYIVSGARMKLWRAIAAAGLDEVVSCNTDGLLVTKKGGDRLRLATRKGRLPGLRRKASYRYGVEVVNAQAIIDLDPSNPVHKVAGIPRRGVRLPGRRVWVAETVHQTLLEAPTWVTGTFTLPPGALGRQRAPDGLTRPFKVSR